MSLGKSITLVLTAVLLAFTAWPLASTGTVQGTVRDQSGAVVPNVAVVLTGSATNISSKTNGNGAGLYFFPGVVAGRYVWAVEAPGMQRFEGTFAVQVPRG